nr:hypothetical protein StreXyl84_17700 [Streptomyces sp. Xyl84]
MTAEPAGGGTVEILSDDDAAAVLTPATPTSGPYDYPAVRAAFAADGVHDVRLRLHGPVRLAHVGFTG